MSQAENAVDQARQIAREQVLKHDEEKNNLLAQINRERADFATKKDLIDGLEKLGLEMSGNLDRFGLESKADRSSLHSDIREIGNRVGTLEKADIKAQGSDKGNLALVVSLAAILLSIAGNVGMRLIFG